MTIKPMLPTLIKEPFDNPDWIYEIKWDGFRMITEIRKGKIRMFSKNGKEFSRFGQLSASLLNMKCDCILDGEIVVLDQDGRPDFQKLMYSRKSSYTYFVFDIMYLKGKCLMNLCLLRRKEILKTLLLDLVDIKYSDHVEEQGVGLFQLAKQNNLEGIIAKLKTSTYIEGKSRNWLKVKTWKDDNYEERAKMFKKVST